jgi:syntaxin 8
LPRNALAVADNLTSLKKQLSDLKSAFTGFPTPQNTATLHRPNDPSLGPDFAHASSTHRSPPLSPTTSPGPADRKSRSPLRRLAKSVRFTDAAASPSPPPEPYTDDPAAAALGLRRTGVPGEDGEGEGYRDAAEQGGWSNQQVHEHHAAVLAEQDARLDALGESIGRQRELSMMIGDELEGQVDMLDDLDVHVDRHQGRLDRASRRLRRIGESAGESKGVVAIIVLIVILVLLIAVLK